MKSMITMKLLDLVAVIAVAIAMPAWAQEPVKFTGFLCELDPFGIQNKPAGVPASGVAHSILQKTVLTTKPAKPKASQSSAWHRFPEWTGSAYTKEDVPCRINGDHGGVHGFVDEALINV